MQLRVKHASVGKFSLGARQLCCARRLGSAFGAGWGREQISQALTSPAGCVATGGGAVAERRHSEEEHVPPSGHRLPAL